MKKIVSIILAIVVAMSFAGCEKKYTEADLEKAYSDGLNDGVMAAEQEWEVGYEQGLRDGKKSSSGNSYSLNQPTQYVYTGDEDVKWEACEYLNDAYGCLNKAETEINIDGYEDYDVALFYLDEARSKIITALDILGY